LPAAASGMKPGNLILLIGKLTKVACNAEPISLPERFSVKQKRESKVP